ncbi:hypothetical protein C824_001500 [Schaedlerella arabinosiphila]|nr:hypothetical protein C824_001500 [Schaedlerella arabinosiphila]
MNVHYSHEEWSFANNFKYDTYKYWEKKIRRLDSELNSVPVLEQSFIDSRK